MRTSCSTVLLAGGSLALTAATAAAAPVEPPSYSATIEVSETATQTFTVAVAESGPATSLVDVLFLADNTGSVGPAIADVKSEAASLLGTLSGTPGLDIQFGVASYFGDPVEGGVDPGNPTVGGNDNNFAFNLITPVTADTAAVQSGIDAWIASGGGDGPEGGLFALEQVASGGTGPASGLATGLDVMFRDLAQSVVVMFGDIGQHTDTVGLDEAIGVLTDNDVIVNAVSFGFPGLDDGGDPPDGQGTALADATGGVSTDASTDEVAEAILASVTTVIETIDLALEATAAFAGLGVEIECVDAAGCEDVAAGESRDFQASFTGLEAGTYDFDLVAPGIAGGMAEVLITVGDDTAGPGDPGGPVTPPPAVIPLPAGAWLLLTGLLGLGVTRLRRS